MADSNKVVIEFVPDTTKLTAAFQDVQTNLKQVGSTRFDEINKNFAILEQGAKKSGVGAKELSDRFRELGVAIPEDVMMQYSKEVEQVTNKHLTLRTQLQQAKQAFYELTEQGKKGTKEWMEARKELAKLSEQMDDLNKTVQRLASSTKVFAGLLDAAKGVAAGFEVAKGAAILFGAENKKAEEAIKQLVSIMAILQGLQELQLLFKEESAAMQLILNGRDAAYVAIKKLETYAESENIIVKKGAAVAQWALNAAMNANPIMLLVGALAAATAALIYFTSANDDARYSVEEINEAFKRQEDVIKELSQTQIDDGKRKLDLMKAQKAGSKEIHDQEVKNAELEIAQTQKLIRSAELRRFSLMDGYEELTDKEREEIDKSIEANEQRKRELIKQEADLKNQLLILDVHYSQAQAEERKKAHQKELDEFRQAQKDLEELAQKSAEEQQAMYDEYVRKRLIHNAGLEQLKANSEAEEEFIRQFHEHKLEIEEAYNSMSFEDFKKWMQMKREEYANTEKILQELLEQSVKDEEEANKKKLDAIKEQAAFEIQVKKATFQVARELAGAIYQIETQNNRNALDKELASLDERREKELANKNLTEAQKAAIDKRYARIEADAKLKAWKADKEAKIAQASINALLSITEALATLPPPGSYVTAALSFANAMIQVGLIASMKPPAFAKGTKGSDVTPPGFKWVGEEGPELIHEPGGAKIITHPDSMKILEQYNLPAAPSFTPPLPNAPELGALMPLVVNQGIDYKKLAKAFAEELKANPQTHLSIDKNGFTLHLIEKGKRVEKLNARYNG